MKISKKVRNEKLVAQGLELLSEIYKSTSQYEQMKKSAEKALKLFRKTSDKHGEVLTISHIGDYYLFTGNTNRALEYYKKAMKLNKNSKKTKNVANNAISMGIVYSNYLENFRKALKYYQTALKVARSISDIQIEASSLNNIGNTYYYMSDLDKAMEYNNRSIEIVEGIGDKKGIAAILNNMGVMNYVQGQFKIAVELFLRSINIREQIGDRRGIGICLHNLGFIYDDMNNRKNAIKHYIKALNIRRDINDQFGEAETLNSIGNYYIRINKYKKALKYCNLSLFIREKNEDFVGIAKCNKNIGKIYLEMKKYSKALLFFGNYFSYIKKKRDEKLIEEMYDILGLIHYKIGNTKDSIKWYKKLIALDNKDIKAEKYIEAIINMYKMFISLNKRKQAINILTIGKAYLIAAKRNDLLKKLKKYFYNYYKSKS